MIDNISEAKAIIKELYNEFLEEEKKINDVCDSHSVRIDELDHKISGFRKNDDVDYKVFSPRNRSTYNTEKIAELETEKETLEKEMEFSQKQLRYYSDKVNKLERILMLLNISPVGEVPLDLFDGDNTADENSDGRINNYSELLDDNSVDPIEALFRPDSVSSKEGESSGEDIDKVMSNIDSLFSKNILPQIFGDDHKGLVETVETIDSIDDSDNQNNQNSIYSDVDKDGIESTETFENLNNNVPEKENITPGQIAHIIHKIEFTSKIMSNDSHRAKIELKEILNMLRNLIK